MTFMEKLQHGYYDSNVEENDKPVRPFIGKYPTAEYARQYANEKEVYDAAIITWENTNKTNNDYIDRQSNKLKHDALEDAFGEDLLRFPNLIEQLYRSLKVNFSAKLETYTGLEDLVIIVQAAKDDTEALMIASNK